MKYWWMQNTTSTTTEENQSETIQVPISRGYFVTIDKDDYERVTEWKWTALPTKWTVYARRNIKKNGKQHSFYLHRFLMGDPEGFEVDHKDGNGLNCSKSNLRIATKKQQAQNQKKSNRNTSGFKGVSRDGASRWKAYICIGKEYIHLGSYSSKEEAAAARKAAAAILHKDFARHE